MPGQDQRLESVEQTNTVAGIRFAFFFVQAICIIAMGILVAISALRFGSLADITAAMELVRFVATSRNPKPLPKNRFVGTNSL